MLNLADSLEGHDDLGGGVFWRHGGTEVVNSGEEPTPPIQEDVRPRIGRRLSKWGIRAYRNGHSLKIGHVWLGHGIQQR